MSKQYIKTSLSVLVNYHDLFYWFVNVYDECGVTSLTWLHDLEPYNIPKLIKEFIKYQFDLVDTDAEVEVCDVPTKVSGINVVAKVSFGFSDSYSLNAFKIKRPNTYMYLKSIPDDVVYDKYVIVTA